MSLLLSPGYIQDTSWGMYPYHGVEYPGYLSEHRRSRSRRSLLEKGEKRVLTGEGLRGRAGYLLVPPLSLLTGVGNHG